MIVSGESGAGKTESTKLVLSYVAENARSAGQYHKKVFTASPILEAFGNATTVRNKNSSRFGKFIEMSLLERQVVGATIRVYLLELTRVCFQAPAERNYYIFYQLGAVCGAKYGLGSVKAFHYIRQGRDPAFGDHDQKNFEELVEAFETFGFGAE